MENEIKERMKALKTKYEEVEALPKSSKNEKALDEIYWAWTLLGRQLSSVRRSK